MAGRIEARPRFVGRAIRRISVPFERMNEQISFYGHVLRRLPAGLRYRGMIAALVSDITIGAGAILFGAGMFFVIFSMAFFTGTQVGLEGFQGLEQIGAEAFV